MIITTQTKKIGDSLWILIPAGVRNGMKIKEGDFILVDIMNKVDMEDKVKHYRCKVCEHHFHTDEDAPYCPVCDETNKLEVIRE